MNEQTNKPTRGRPKGSNSFVKVRLSDLQAKVGEGAVVPISAVWLRDQGIVIEEPSASPSIPVAQDPAPEQPKIEFSLVPAEEDGETVFDSSTDQED